MRKFTNFSLSLRQIPTGFNIIELVIIIAIIGILAAIAIPIYQTYTLKAKFTEVVQATTPYKLAVEQCVHKTGVLVGCGNGMNGVPEAADASGYVQSVTTSSTGVITAASQNLSTNYTYILTPSLDANGKVIWESGGTCVNADVC